MIVRAGHTRLAAALALGGLCAISGCKSAGHRAGANEPQQPGLAEAQRRALSAQRMKDPQEALEAYGEAVRAYPEFPSAWNNMGVLLMDRKQYLDAAEAFARAGEMSPRDPRPLYNLGLTWDRCGYLEDALKHYLEALDRDPRYQPALRGAIRAERILSRADEQTLTRLRIAIGQESDEEWRLYLELQKSFFEDLVYRPASSIGGPVGRPSPSRPAGPSMYPDARDDQRGSPSQQPSQITAPTSPKP